MRKRRAQVTHEDKVRWIKIMQADKERQKTYHKAPTVSLQRAGGVSGQKDEERHTKEERCQELKA